MNEGLVSVIMALFGALIFFLGYFQGNNTGIIVGHVWIVGAIIYSSGGGR